MSSVEKGIMSSVEKGIMLSEKAINVVSLQRFTLILINYISSKKLFGLNKNNDWKKIHKLFLKWKLVNDH
jgi:hypothetical protein